MALQGQIPIEFGIVFPCSPRCANWLRYGIQPKNARPGLTPGARKGKAHDADHLG